MPSARRCWGMVQEKASLERCSSWTVLHAQCTNALSSVVFSQGNAKALERGGGKAKHRLISYFLRNTSAKIIAIGSCISRLQQVIFGTFLRHSVEQTTNRARHTDNTTPALSSYFTFDRHVLQRHHRKRHSTFSSGPKDNSHEDVSKISVSTLRKSAYKTRVSNLNNVLAPQL